MKYLQRMFYKLKCFFNKHLWYTYYETSMYNNTQNSRIVQFCMACGKTEYLKDD